MLLFRRHCCLQHEWAPSWCQLDALHETSMIKYSYTSYIQMKSNIKHQSKPNEKYWDAVIHDHMPLVIGASGKVP